MCLQDYNKGACKDVEVGASQDYWWEAKCVCRGRNMLNSVLIANEIMDNAKMGKQKCLVFKVDFEKAYDCVCLGNFYFIWKGGWALILNRYHGK